MTNFRPKDLKRLIEEIEDADWEIIETITNKKNGVTSLRIATVNKDEIFSEAVVTREPGNNYWVITSGSHDGAGATFQEAIEDMRFNAEQREGLPHRQMISNLEIDLANIVRGGGKLSDVDIGRREIIRDRLLVARFLQKRGL